MTGTFDNWSKSEKMDKVGDAFEKTVDLPDTSEKIYYKVGAAFPVPVSPAAGRRVCLAPPPPPSSLFQSGVRRCTSKTRLCRRRRRKCDCTGPPMTQSYRWIARFRLQDAQTCLLFATNSRTTVSAETPSHCLLSRSRATCPNCPRDVQFPMP